MDHSKETIEHQQTVSYYILEIVKDLIDRANDHDASKLSDSEKPYFDIYTPKLKDCTYNSEEYKKYLSELKPALDHHYANNRHHPEHFPDGINGMNLIDLIEMLADWKASTLRHQDGNMLKSLEANTKRFDISPQLASILNNTIKLME